MTQAQHNPEPDRAGLFRLLTELFTAEELRQFLSWLPEGAQVSASLPGPSASLAQLCDEAVSILERRGLLDADFFSRLREARPLRAGVIDPVALAWGVREPGREPSGLSLPSDLVATNEDRQPIRAAGLRLAVEASDAERALRVDDYATALATVLDRSDGGVFFAVFGSWGRGKTFLMRRLTKLLPELRLSRRYEAVWFSAWKYPTTPEVWVHLYETLAARAYSGSWFEVTRRVIRSNIERYGIMPAVIILLAGAAAMLPITFYFHILWYLLAAFGLFGLLAIVRVSRAVTSPARRLKRLYLTRVSHAEKLGLQAVIGEDLRALIDGWLHRPADAGVAKQLLSVSLAVVILVAAALWIGLSSLDAANIWVRPLVCGVWVILGSGATVWLALPPRSVDRVLLVVDDLDRCKPDHVCDVIESLKLMTDAPELAGRIQVAALIEEEALDWAIAQRFRGRIDAVRAGDAKVQRNARERLVREHKQKLFIGHLHLPDLSENELAALLQTYLHEGRALVGAVRNSGEAERVTANVVVTGNTPPTAPQSASPVRRSILDVTRQAHDGDLFETHEREALMRVAPLFHKALWGPRAVRSFLFRYQLARLLLLTRGSSAVSPETLARGLLGASTGTAVDEDLRAVLDMVR